VWILVPTVRIVVSESSLCLLPGLMFGFLPVDFIEPFSLNSAINHKSNNVLQRSPWSQMKMYSRMKRQQQILYYLSIDSISLRLHLALSRLISPYRPLNLRKKPILRLLQLLIKQNAYTVMSYALKSLWQSIKTTAKRGKSNAKPVERWWWLISLIFT